MKYCVVVVTICAVGDEVLTCFGDSVAVELKVERTEIGLNANITFLFYPGE